MGRIRLALWAATAAMALSGCSPSSRDEYKSASNEAAQAIKTDANTTAHAFKAMGDSAKQSIAKDEHKTASSSSPSKGGSSDDMAGQITNALTNTSGLDSSHITVNQSGNKVILEGTVPDAHQKNQAHALAKTMCGGSYTLADKLRTTG